MQPEKLALFIVSQPNRILEEWSTIFDKKTISANDNQPVRVGQEEIALLDLCTVRNNRVESRTIMINSRQGNGYREMYLSRGAQRFIAHFDDMETVSRLDIPIELN